MSAFKTKPTKFPRTLLDVAQKLKNYLKKNKHKAKSNAKLTFAVAFIQIFNQSECDRMSEVSFE